MEGKEIALLAEALHQHFPAGEARQLADLLSQAGSRDSISYAEIDLPSSSKDDIILLAYEERLVLPMKSILGSAWADRILDFRQRERYHILRVVRFLVESAQKSGKWQPGYAIREALKEAGESKIEEMLVFIDSLSRLAFRHDIEVGVMQAISTKLGLEMDMHDALDRCTRCGIMSPLTQRSLHTGFAKYEMNPCLCWDFGR